MELPSTSLGRFLYYTFRVVHTTMNNFMAIPAYVVWCFLLYPLKKLQPTVYWRVENVMFKALLSYVVMWANSGGYRIIESGDDLSTLHDKHVLVLVNHQSTADIPCSMSILQPRGMVLGQVMWIMDHLFVFTNFGICSYLHHDFFIQQGKKGRDGQLEKLRDHLLQEYLPTDKRWIVLFPEGGFLNNRREANHRYAKKNNLPLLSHVTFPRLGAIETILDNIGVEKPTDNGSGDLAANAVSSGATGRTHCVNWIVDVTLAYPDGEPIDMVGIMIGWWKPRNMLVHYRAYPVSDISTDSEERTKWLYDRYIEKEAMLDGFYKDKKFLDESDHQKRVLPQIQRGEVPFDKRWMVAAYVFYTFSAYIFWLYVYCPLWSLITYPVSCIF